MTLIPVSREAHITKKVRNRSSFEFVRGSGVVPLYGAELARAAHEFPLCFTPTGEGFFPAALMAVEPGKNVFVSLDGQWLGNYLPAVMRREPFALAKVEATGNWVLCLDDASELLSETEGQPLFTDDGQPSPLVSQATEFLIGLERDRQVTLAACAALERHGLLTPWPLQVAANEGPVKRIDGLFKVEEAKLRDLAADALVELRDRGALTVAYAQLFSLVKLPVIGRLADVHSQLEAQRKSMKKSEVNLDRAFGIGDDDPFQFDFK